jgi:hypothetical protein
MHKADLSMIRDVERRAVAEWCRKNKFHQRIAETYWKGVEQVMDQFEYKDMIKDFWRDLLPD